MPKHALAFLGLGSMGSRMVKNLLDAGYDVTVWNREKPPVERLAAQGAQAAETPRQAAEGADIIFSMVTDDDASRNVWLQPETGAVSGLKKDAIAIESSTVTPRWIKELSAAVEARGARFLDCPVSGSLPQVEARQFVVLAGGETAAFEQAKPVLHDMAGSATHMGDVGQGIAMKLAVNALLGIQLAAFSEALGFLRRSGLDATHVLDALESMPVASPAALAGCKLMLAKDFAPRFPIDLVEKDFRYTLECGEEIGATLPVTATVHDLFKQLQNSGHGRENISALARLSGL